MFHSAFIPFFIKKKENRTLLENVVSLSVFQAVNYLLPLLTMPYLVRVLGIEKFGLIVFAQMFIQYFVICADYGFDLTATQEISIHREDGERISRIFSTVMVVKMMIMVIGFFFMIVMVSLFAKFAEHRILYVLTFGWVVGQVLFPQWFFQGMERMKYIALLNLFAKVFFTIAIFVFVKNADDYLLQPLLFSMSFIIAGLIAQYKVRKDFKIKFIMPGMTEVKKQLHDGWHIFLSTMSVTVYSISNTVILGLLTNNTYVGYFAVADKLIYGAKILLSPIRQALFPFISKKFSESKDAGLKIARNVMKAICMITLSESLVLLLFAGSIIRIVMGGAYRESISVLKIMSFLPLIIGINNVLGLQVMLPLTYNKPFSRIIMAAGALNTIVAFVLVPFFKHIGIAVTVVLTETFVAAAMYLFLKNKGINLFAKIRAKNED